MNPLMIFVAAVLMAFVSIACAVVCVAWTVPGWRVRLSRSSTAIPSAGTENQLEMTCRAAVVGSGLISLGIASCAAVSAYGCYAVLSASSVFNR